MSGEMLGGQSKRGRPRKEPEIGTRVALSIRMTPDLKRRLDEAADRGGRSLTQEAEYRLQASFDRQDLLTDVLTLAYGEEIAARLIAIGNEMSARRPGAAAQAVQARDCGPARCAGHQHGRAAGMGTLPPLVSGGKNP